MQECVVINRKDLFKALEEDKVDVYISGMLMETYDFIDSYMEQILNWLALEWMKGTTYQSYQNESILAYGFYNENEMVVYFYQLQLITSVTEVV